jgi:hypothetical protein
MELTFDHEKLDVYGLELQFVAWTTDFLEEVSQSPRMESTADLHAYRPHLARGSALCVPQAEFPQAYHPEK